MRKALILILLVCLGAAARADIRLPRIFSSHMVLQQKKPVPVWGWADAGEKITLVLATAGKPAQTKTGRAGKDGKWLLNLDAVDAGGPYEVVVSGKKDKVSIEDVLFGEVWICSGQSNMEMLVSRSANAPEEKSRANFPQIRHFKVPHDRSLTPKVDVTGGEWQLTTPETVGDFSAVAYFFARDLYAKLNVPIGLVNSSWGGTQVESWISLDAMKSLDEFKDHVAGMPASLEALAAARKKELDDKILADQGSFPDAKALQEWPSPTYDNSAWKTIEMPGYFDLKALPGLDGVVWLRKEIDLPERWADKPMILMLGPVDDIDVTYVNGIKIGESGKKTPIGRNYIIPANILRAGRNVIAVRIEDLGSIGGFAGKPEQMKLALEDYELSIAGSWQYRVESSVEMRQLSGANVTSTILYNAMIAPLVPYAMRGVIWYQGETNAPRAYQYRKSFPLMITDWRKRWKEDFPFHFVQLASYSASNGNSGKGSTWAELREAQTLTLGLPNTGMAVTSDIGESQDIHPKNKQEVGRRLGYSALAQVYGQKIEYSGPVYESMKTNGNAVTISFKHAESGLKASDKYGYVKGFEIAGADRKFYWAQARIEDDRLVVWSEQVSAPAAVRYGWADDNVEANLYNKEGIPAVPFRTDSWKGITEGVYFK